MRSAFICGNIIHVTVHVLSKVAGVLKGYVPGDTLCFTFETDDIGMDGIT